MPTGNVGKLYYLTSGSRASWGSVSNGYVSAAAPSNLTLVGKVVDVKVANEKGKADASNRDSAFKQYAGVLRDQPVSFKLVKDMTNAGQLAMLKSYMASGVSAVIALAILDGDKATSGSFGYWGDYEVFKMEEGQPLEGIDTWDIEVSPSIASAIDPQMVIIP